jgi:hypothetical protein
MSDSRSSEIPPDAGEDRDATDPRRDPFAPPAEPCECYCLHCQRVFMSDLMWFQRIINGRDENDGTWMCPTPNCSGIGFTFDIFPTDPDHPANEGWVECDEDDEEFDEFEESDDEEDLDRGWDPDETRYKQLDELYGSDDDIEGEEWKYGLAPGETPPEPAWARQAREEWEAEQKQYDEPDRRPRVVDWTDRNPSDSQLNEDDIPF